jgi:hypothetical protein
MRQRTIEWSDSQTDDVDGGLDGARTPFRSSRNGSD